MRKRWCVVLAALFVMAAAHAAAAQAPAAVNVNVVRDGAAAPNVGVEFRSRNEGTRAIGVTDGAGALSIAMSAINGGKPVRTQVVVYDCAAGQDAVVFVEAGAQVEDRNCDRRVAGWFWFGRTAMMTVDLARAIIVSNAVTARMLGIRDRSLMFGGGVVMPTGQLGNETSAGWRFVAALSASFLTTQQFRLSARLRGEHARYPGAATMPGEFSAAQMAMAIDMMLAMGNGMLTPFVTGGAGVARNSLKFGDTTSSSWKPGFNFGGGLGYRLGEKSMLGAELRYQKHDTFGGVGLAATYSFAF